MAAEPETRLRRSAWMAALALTLLVTSCLLDWWVLNNETAGVSNRVADVSLVSGPGNTAHPTALWLSIGFVVLAGAVLFIRLAAVSWQHEPKSWRRDLVVSAIFVAVALICATFWPIEYPFWGGRTYQLTDGSGTEFSMVGMPGLGWWLALFAVLLLGWARWMSHASASAAEQRTH